jgi:CRP-like cAMP-binding protein
MDPHPDAIHFLKSHPPSVGVETASMTTIASRCRPRSRQAGESLFLESDPCRDLCILMAGRVKGFRASPEA